MSCGPICSSCSTCTRAALRDPHALMLAAEQAGGAIGDLLPKVVSPSTVAELKRQLEPSVLATDAAVDRCTGLEPGERAAWKAWLAAWTLYRNDDNASFLWFGSANKYDEGIVFQSQLAQWQEQLRGKCPIPGPVVVVPDTGAPPALKWAAAAVITVAVVYGIRTIVK